MTYIHSLSYQLYVFLLAAGAGMILGAVYALFRLPCRMVALNALTVICDVLFSLFCCAFTFFFVLAFNDGVVRNYVFTGEALGFAVFTFSTGLIISRAETRLKMRIKRKKNEHGAEKVSKINAETVKK